MAHKKYRFVSVRGKLKSISGDLGKIIQALSYLKGLEKYLGRVEKKIKKLDGLLKTTEDEQKTGPVQVREEVVGTSSKAKNKNMGNSGFSGGELIAA